MHIIYEGAPRRRQGDERRQNMCSLMKSFWHIWQRIQCSFIIRWILCIHYLYASPCAGLNARSKEIKMILY